MHTRARTGACTLHTANKPNTPHNRLMDYSLIANSGIQLIAFRLKIDTQQRHRQWFREWYDSATGEWKLELVHEISDDTRTGYYATRDLFAKGYRQALSTGAEVDPADLDRDGIKPLRIDDEMADGVEGEIFSMSFNDRDFKLSALENEWLPVPYFFKRTATRYTFGPLNWSRIKLVPAGDEGAVKNYDVLLAFDTRTNYENEGTNETPNFPDRFRKSIELGLCDNELQTLDFCSPDKPWSYINQRIFSLVNSGVSQVSQLRGPNLRRTAYAASYLFLMDVLVRSGQMPVIELFKDTDVVVSDVDMVVDIGNSRTTALLIEDNRNFNQVRPLTLVDYTEPLVGVADDAEPRLNVYSEPFDMRIAFRREDFGGFGLRDSRQFIYPSLVRLGTEAIHLMHRASATADSRDTLSTYSSPKRYLWDGKPNKEEWQFMVLPGEADNHVLDLPGVTNWLRSDGTLDSKGEGGLSYHYSRRSLMTLSFLEMLVQAHSQVNSPAHRSIKSGLGNPELPRRIKRIVVTCPTAMSKVEREALVGCARDAVAIFSHMGGTAAPTATAQTKPTIEVIPELSSRRDADPVWYYDEATCSQLVYMYGEVGHKYRGCCSEFFKLYGKTEPGDDQPSITVGSLDIGAGTSDLMISKYTYRLGQVTTITPEPLFYDSFYFAGDDMLSGLIKNIMLLDEDSALRTALPNSSYRQYRQIVKNFFGPDHNDQTLADRILRKDFNLQYSVPLMHHFLELLRTGSKDCQVRYDDVFGSCPPNQAVLDGFREHTGIDVTDIVWQFNNKKVSRVVEKEFEPLLKKIATIMFAHACDIVLLSGRPASLPAVRDIFLKYYSVSPDRLIILNNYYVGDWYPFSANTGYITNPKTIVAMGGIIGHYASALSNLNKFVIDLSELKNKLKSTVNFIEASREGQPISYFLTPEKAVGDIAVDRLPAYLNVRQIGLDSYPCRSLYTIDFNRHKIADSIRRRAFADGLPVPSDSAVVAMVNEQIETLRKRMPFTITIERDPDNKEQLSIAAITDKEGNEVSDRKNLEVNIQSLGANDSYWLDTGEFYF